MNSLHILYLESVLGIKIGEFEAQCASFTGQLSIETISKVCEDGVVSWQNPECPVVDKAYLTTSVDDGVIDFAIDYNFNVILVA